MAPSFLPVTTAAGTATRVVTLADPVAASRDVGQSESKYEEIRIPFTVEYRI
jgi:hypothetical protein